MWKWRWLFKCWRFIRVFMHVLLVIKEKDVRKSAWSQHRICCTLLLINTLCNPLTKIVKKCLVSPCDSGPCENGGECSNVGNSFECKCPSGYKGKRCQEIGTISFYFILFCTFLLIDTLCIPLTKIVKICFSISVWFWTMWKWRWMFKCWKFLRV